MNNKNLSKSVFTLNHMVTKKTRPIR